MISSNTSDISSQIVEKIFSRDRLLITYTRESSRTRGSALVNWQRELILEKSPGRSVRNLR